jgi:hypothetical protein
VVVTVSVVVAGAPLGAIEAGVNEQLAPDGSPAQANDTDWLNPFSGSTVTVNAADCPCLMVAVGGLALTS